MAEEVGIGNVASVVGANSYSTGGTTTAAGVAVAAPEPTTPTTQQSATPAQQANLDDDPRFREWKSRMDRQVADAQRQYQNAMRAVQQQQQQYDTLRKQVENNVLGNMDETAQLEYKLQMEAQQRQTYEQRLQEIEGERRRDEILAEMQGRYGIDARQDPRSLEHPMNALVYVADQQMEQVKSLRAEVERLTRELGARSAAREEKPDLGNGAPMTTASDIQRNFDAAMLRGDSVEADRLSQAATKAKVTLDRYGWLGSRGQKPVTVPGQ